MLLVLVGVVGIVGPVYDTAAGSIEPIELARRPSVVGPISARGLVVVAYGNPSAISIAAYDANAHLRWKRDLPGGSFSGELQACEDLVYAPAFQDGVYVFGARDGRLKAHLLPRLADPTPLVVCTPERVCMRAFHGRAATVVAFETKRFRKVWQVEFPDQRISELTTRGTAIAVAVAEGIPELPHGNKLVTLRANDGRRLSARANPELPLEYGWDWLPPRARAQLSRLFVRREANETHYLEHTPIVRLKQLVAVGRGHYADAMLFCIRADTGRIVWQRDAPGLVSIVRVSDRLVALYAVPDMAYPDSAKRLDWLDFRTGRLLRSVRLGNAP